MTLHLSVSLSTLGGSSLLRPASLVDLRRVDFSICSAFICCWNEMATSSLLICQTGNCRLGSGDYWQSRLVFDLNTLQIFLVYNHFCKGETFCWYFLLKLSAVLNNTFFKIFVKLESSLNLGFGFFYLYQSACLVSFYTGKDKLIISLFYSSYI